MSVITKNITKKTNVKKSFTARPKSPMKRSTRKGIELPVVDFFQAYDQALHNTKTAIFAMCPVDANLASWILSINNQNRKITQGRVDRYAAQMIRKKWRERESGDIIRINDNGHLMDGQHRMKAIVQSKVTLILMFVFNVDSEAFVDLDTGKTRNVPDVMSIVGHQYASHLGPALNMVQRWEMGDMLSSYNITNQEALDLLDRHMGLLDSLSFVSKIQTYGLISRPNLAFLHYVFSEKNQRQANKFISLLISGEGLMFGDPIYMLRERLIKAKTNGSKSYKLTRIQKVALSIKSWNAIRKGKDEMKSLSWGRKGESFPKIY